MSVSVADATNNAPARSPGGAAAGTRPLIRLILRRDRVWLPVWVLLSLSLVLSRASSKDGVYPDAAAREARYRDVMHDVPMFKLFQGPAYDDTAPALVAQETIGGATLFAALGAIIFLVKHTRGEEQTGRTELVGSAAVGRHAPLTAALTVVFGAGAILAALSFAGLVGAGMPVAGSLAFGLIVGSGAWIGAGLAALLAQLLEASRAAGAIAFALFMGMHFVRGAFDLGGGALTWFGWLVPNGWLQRTRPYADERWWTFLLVAALVTALLWAAYALSARRDLGAGLIATRPGPARAAPRLRSPIGLAWRLNRTMAAVWTAAAVFIALPSGFVGTQALAPYADSRRMRAWADSMGSSNPSDAFFAYIAFTTVFPITLYAIMTVLRVVQEERTGHAELLLSAPVSRVRWAAAHVSIALAIPVVLQFILGLSFGLGSDRVGEMLTTTLSLIPAVWVMIGIATAACGLLRRGAAVVAWGAFIVTLIFELGQHLNWHEWTFKVFSPFAHVLPFYGPPGALTLAVLTGIAAVLVAAGFSGLRRRDMLVLRGPHDGGPATGAAIVPDDKDSDLAASTAGR